MANVLSDGVYYKIVKFEFSSCNSWKHKDVSAYFYICVADDVAVNGYGHVFFYRSEGVVVTLAVQNFCFLREDCIVQCGINSDVDECA